MSWQAFWSVIDELFTKNDSTMPPTQPNPAPSNVQQTQPTQLPPLLWDTPKNAWHAVRVLCDDEGLTLQQKDLICAVIYGESGFLNTARNDNKNNAGVITSVDYGICQINSRYHIGMHLDFPSVQYVLDNPDIAVRFMISMYKAGKIGLWCAYQNGSYRNFLGKIPE